MNDQLLDEESLERVSLSREQGIFDKSVSLCMVIGIFCVFSLFAFLHFKEIKVEVLELGAEAERYVVAQEDFAFYDEEASIILRQEAARDIGDILKLKEKEIRSKRAEFEKFLTTNQKWRSEIEHTTFEEVSKGIDLLEAGLSKARITNSRTLNKMMEVHLPTENYFVYTPDPSKEESFLPEDFWTTFAEKAFNAYSFQQGTKEFILSHFKIIPWKLESDTVAQRSLRRLVESHVPRKFTKVNAGDRIIDQGEIVNTRHLAMMQSMKKALSDSRNLLHPTTLFGSLLLSCLFVGLGAYYLRHNHPKVFTSNKKLFLLVTILLLDIFLAKVTEFFILKTTVKITDFVRYPILVPFPAILICTLLRSGVATFASGFLIVVMAQTLAVDPLPFITLNLFSSAVAIYSTRALYKRKEIFVICGKAWLCCAAVILSLHLYQNTLFSLALFVDLFTTGLFMIVTGILVVGLLPLLESGFRIMTDVTLMEYMDPNHPLLRRMALEAPGTYQHSVVVGNIAEAAAISIGASGLFCRISALYHDIGKMVTPHFFTENQQGGVNIHQLLTPLESTQVIISHVSEGVAMGRKAGLPEQFIDIIKEHHGTTLVSYFYQQQLETSSGEGVVVEEKDYRYTGPKPHSKESAIIMIADSLEAASRSLDELTEVSVTNLVESIVKAKSEDGQFDECRLTFKELGIVKKTMIKTLVAVSHSRIKYPTFPTKDEKGKSKEAIEDNS